MSGLRLNKDIINAVLNSGEVPLPGQRPQRKDITVTITGRDTYTVPTVVAHVFVAGSGPIGCSFARTLLDRANKQPSVVIAEIGSQEGAVKGRNLKNSFKYQKDIDAFVHVIQGHLQPISVAENHPSLNVPNNNPNQEHHTNLPGSAVTRTVGGMATHWTCCCPRPHEADERKNSPIESREFDPLFNRAGQYLTINDTLFNYYIRHTIVMRTLQVALPARNVRHLPLGVSDRNTSRNYLTWAGSDTVLGSIAASDRMLWLTETRVTYLDWETIPNSSTKTVRAAVVRDYNTNGDVLIIARAYVIACGAIGTPQILYNSRIRPPALGRYLSEQSIAFCQIVLKNSIVDSEQYLSPDQKRRRNEHKAAHPGDIPIPFNDLEPQVYIPYAPSTPWHVQVHRDAFSYGDVGPSVDPRLIVDLRFFGKSDINVNNRVYFPPETAPSDPEWKRGEKDLYGMPQPTFEVTMSDADLARNQRMMAEMNSVAKHLGGFLPAAQPQFMPPGLALHITGTTRMQPKGVTGDEIKRVSVVGLDSKVHDYNNLWLGGCNVIPDSMACNPTRTAIAYAIKAAEAIHTQLNLPA